MDKKLIAIVLIATAAFSFLFVQEGTAQTPEANAEELIKEYQGFEVETNGEAMAAEEIVKEIAGEMAEGAMPVETAVARRYGTQIDIYKGVAVDKYRLQTRNIILLRIGDHRTNHIYLLIGGEIHKLKFMDVRHERNMWIMNAATQNNEKVLFLVQETNGIGIVTGLFRNYLLSFEPVYLNHPRPTKPECVPRTINVPFIGPIVIDDCAYVQPVVETVSNEPFWR